MIVAEAVKELYDKMLESVNTKRSMPPNAWLWQMIANCKHQHDIGLLFEVLQKLRTFVSFSSFSAVNSSICLFILFCRCCDGF